MGHQVSADPVTPCGVGPRLVWACLHEALQEGGRVAARAGHHHRPHLGVDERDAPPQQRLRAALQHVRLVALRPRRRATAAVSQRAMVGASCDSVVARALINIRRHCQDNEKQHSALAHAACTDRRRARLDVHLGHDDVIQAAAQQVVQARKLQPARPHDVPRPRDPPGGLVAGQGAITLRPARLSSNISCVPSSPVSLHCKPPRIAAIGAVDGCSVCAGAHRDQHSNFTHTNP